MKDSKRSAGIGGILGVIIVFALYEVFTVATNLAMPAREIEANSGDVLAVLGQEVWHGVGGKLLVIAVMLSTIATLETTLIQVTRSLFAMSREKTLPEFLGRILPVRQTPWLATIAVAVVSLGLFIGSNYVGSVGTILTDAIDAIGMQICVYRRGLHVLDPRRVHPSDGAVVDWFGVGGLAIGFIPLVIYWVKGSPYFKQKPTLGSVLPADAV